MSLITRIIIFLVGTVIIGLTLEYTAGWGLLLFGLLLLFVGEDIGPYNDSF